MTFIPFSQGIIKMTKELPSQQNNTVHHQTGITIKIRFCRVFVKRSTILFLLYRCGNRETKRLSSLSEIV